MRSDLMTRSVVGGCLVVLAAGALYLGGVAFWALTSLAGVLMIGEWAALHGAGPRGVRLAQFALSVPLAIASPLASGPGFLALGLFIGAGGFIAATARSGGQGAGAVYIGLPVLALLLLRGDAHGLLLASWALATVWATDIGAYFAGRAIGGPKVAPAISPNKTWAGVIGGMLAASLFGIALHALGGLPMRLMIAAPALAVAAQAGDFYESWLKRRAGVKDSGTLLPGHGGVLDRLDGVVPVAPLAALWALAHGWG